MRPPFLDKLSSERPAPSIASAARALAARRHSKDRQTIREQCDRMAQEIGREPIQWRDA